MQAATFDHVLPLQRRGQSETSKNPGKVIAKGALGWPGADLLVIRSEFELRVADGLGQAVAMRSVSQIASAPTSAVSIAARFPAICLGCV